MSTVAASAPLDGAVVLHTVMTGRAWAYTGVLLGGAVSIAANVAHSYVPPADARADWSPHAGAVVGAVFWPVALFVAIEILSATPWPDGPRWAVLRFAGLLPVAVVAAVVSYRHLSGLLLFYREDRLTAAIGPLAVDGLMVMATGALVATGRRRAVLGDRAAVLARTTVPPEDRTAVPGEDQTAAAHDGHDAAGSPEVAEAADAPEVPAAQDDMRTSPVPDTADLLLLGRAIAAELAHAGRPLTRASLTEGMRARGRGISTGRATELLRRLRDATEPAA
jgi:hypothetical protein